ncbi:MAG: dihydroorotate dehydrogenase electron transfer subunit [Syntrophales bacterium]
MTERGIMMSGIILESRGVAPDHFHLSVRMPLDFADPLPGQFVMIRASLDKEPLLARPFSVFGFRRYRDHGVLELLFRVCGRGTSRLARLKPGDELAVIGPLGSGFTLPAGTKQILFVAGGVGVAPLAYLLHHRLLATGAGGECRKNFYIGARSAELLTALERLRDVCELGICTDNGSRGYHGPVTAMLKNDIGRYDPGETIIYACGPTPMIRALTALLGEHPIPCQVSLEERMACGLGACLGCAVAIRGADGKREYRRVCQDGPVFNLQQVLFAPAGGE